MTIFFWEQRQNMRTGLLLPQYTISAKINSYNCTMCTFYSHHITGGHGWGHLTSITGTWKHVSGI